MATIIDPSDRRTAKALEILTTSGQWLKCRDGQGRKRYGIESQRNQNRYYLVDTRHCNCPDQQRHPEVSCKHRMAVQFFVSLVKFQTTQ